jgi:hypothetical protein
LKPSLKKMVVLIFVETSNIIKLQIESSKKIDKLVIIALW